MMDIQNSLYLGSVVHKRMRPVQHALSYRVFSVLLDCDEISKTAKSLRLFSYNKFNLFSIYDRDHGNGKPLASYLSEIARELGDDVNIQRFFMLCYPRIFGYAFNPITVFYGLDANGDFRVMIYEVNNTFGQRKTYVLPVAGPGGDLITQSCRKTLYVSPFNTDTGVYRFAVTKPQETLTVGVALRTDLGPTMKAHFHGARSDLVDKNLLKALITMGWMTVKVTGAIHYEALKLWLKGLRFVKRPGPPSEPIDFPAQTKKSAP